MNKKINRRIVIGLIVVVVLAVIVVGVLSGPSLLRLSCGCMECVEMKWPNLHAPVSQNGGEPTEAANRQLIEMRQVVKTFESSAGTFTALQALTCKWRAVILWP